MSSEGHFWLMVLVEIMNEIIVVAKEELSKSSFLIQDLNHSFPLQTYSHP